MKVEQEQLLTLISKPDVRFRVPLYQRVYAWAQRQCDELWNDVMCAADADADHFIGTVLYGWEGADGGQCAEDAAIDLVDGQQRFVTVTLLLAAMRDGLADRPDILDGIDPHDINARYLFVSDASGARTKMELSHADQPTLQAILDRTPLPQGDALSRNVAENHRFFRDRLEDPGIFALAWRGLHRLSVIAAQLEEDDQPQAVFESLNAKGMPLTPADLIRNLLLVRFGYNEQERLFHQYWEQIENLFPEDDAMPDLYLNAALHAWLEENAPSLKLQDKSEIYMAFKAYVRSHLAMPLEKLLGSLHASCVAFAQDLGSSDAKRHVDWVQGKLTGLVSERKLFGD